MEVLRASENVKRLTRCGVRDKEAPHPRERERVRFNKKLKKNNYYEVASTASSA